MCPSQTRDRGVVRLSDDMIFNLAVEAYEEHGFRGLVGFHYYNEPMAEAPRMLSIMERIKARLPEQARFILWTNGLIQPDDSRVAMFEQVHVSDYYNQAEKLRHYFRHNPNVNVFTPVFDDRLKRPSDQVGYQLCRRPMIECIFDAWGRMRLCCQDWRGEVVLGDLRSHSFKELLEKREKVILEIAGQKMREGAPMRCLRCHARMGSHPFDPVIATEGDAWCHHIPNE